MMNLMMEMMANYVKYGMIAWAIWFTGMISYTAWIIARNLTAYMVRKDKLSINKIGKYTKLNGIQKIARTVIWPWGIIDRTNVAIEELSKLKRELTE